MVSTSNFSSWRADFERTLGLYRFKALLHLLFSLTPKK
jgi:hypothetical protein